MCIILFSYKNHETYDLILAANRDEFRDRPTQALTYWPDSPHVLAGRDLLNNGTWMGISKTGRFAALTNFRRPSAMKMNSPSRGALVKDFLVENIPVMDYLESIQSVAKDYSGFNLIVGDMKQLYYVSNCKDGVQQISPGLHGLSNSFINTPWPKVETGKQKLDSCLSVDHEPDIKKIFQILSDDTRAADEQLPNTGVGLEWERLMSPIFISDSFYGTCSQSIILISKNGHVTFYEQTIHRDSNHKGSVRKYSFQVQTL